MRTCSRTVPSRRRESLIQTLALTAALLGSPACSSAPTPAPSTPPAAEAEPKASAPQLGKSPVAEVIAALTREEKVRLVLGTGLDGVELPPELAPPEGSNPKGRVRGAAAETYAIPRLGIPSIVLADGPAGLRISPEREEAPGESYYCTAFPIATALASSWDVSLVEAVGKAMGAEVRGHGVDVLLAPALNVQRVPLGGRNFEYFSEDPLLGGSMAAAVVRGVQSNGVGTSVKHFVANDHEWNRNVLNVRVDERPLREIYLRGFEIAVKEGQPWTVMSSYNRINGTYTSEDPRLLTTILRSEWGFEGLVMTDWFGGSDVAAQMNAGNDVLMPGTERQRKQLLAALLEGRLEESVLDRNIANLLALIVKTPAFSKEAAPAIDLKAGAAVARTAAGQGMVLLKNERGRLPLAKGGRLALFGNGSYETVTGGTGSGDVHEAYAVSLVQGLEAAGFELDAAIRQRFEAHLATENPKLPKRVGIQAFMPAQLAREPEIDTAALVASARDSAAAVITLRRTSGEFVDRVPEDFYLDAAEKALVSAVSKAFRAAGKPVVAVLNVGGAVEVDSWRDRVDAILVASQPGQEAGHAVSDVLGGAVNPSGRLPMTFPRDWKDLPASKGFPGKVLEAADGAQPSPGGGARAAEIEYGDGVEVGYRSLRQRPVKPAYAFGHGLSFTSFEYGALEVTSKGGTPERWTATLSITNSGKVPGAEVVQLYVSAPREGLPRPLLELRRFGKTRQLAPGEAQTLAFELGPRELASFDPKTSAWVVAAGRHSVQAGSSVSDLRRSAALEVGSAVSMPLR